MADCRMQLPSVRTDRPVILMLLFVFQSSSLNRLLWGQAFILAIGNLAIAGAAAEWFLADDKKALSAPAVNSARRTLRYHVGTAVCLKHIAVPSKCLNAPDEYSTRDITSTICCLCRRLSLLGWATSSSACIAAADSHSPN